MLKLRKNPPSLIILIALAALAMTTPVQAVPQAQSAFLPVPRASQITASKNALPQSFRIEWRGHRSPLLTRAAERFEQSWTRRLQTVTSPGPRAVLIIECRSDDPGFLQPTQL
jgi:hypothetical protein